MSKKRVICDIILKLDYTLTSAEERLELVNKILEENKEVLGMTAEINV